MKRVCVRFFLTRSPSHTPPHPLYFQNAFSEYDFNCPLNKSVGMLRCIVLLYNRCLKAVTGSIEGGRAAGDAKTVTWNIIKATCGKAINSVTDMKFKDPRSSDSDFATYFSAVADEVNASFDELADQ